MDCEFDDDELADLYANPIDGGYAREVVKGFRKVMQIVRAAPDERDFYHHKSLHFEKLKGNRSHQHSMRINSQWRLIVELDGTGPNKKVRIKAIEDYH